MEAYVLGAAVHPPADRAADKRLEEMVFDTVRAALDDAGVTRRQLDHVTLAACDELDGRSISSMLLAAPAGAYLKDEIRCTDSGLVGLCLGSLRIGSGLFDLGLVASWCKSSTAPFEQVMWTRCEPFFTRPIGLNASIADALFAQAASLSLGFDEATVNAQVVAACRRAAANPRGMRRPVPALEEVAGSPFVSVPLRRAHQAPITDGAAAMVLASRRWLDGNRHARPLARIRGIGWAADGYELGAERLGGLRSFHAALSRALAAAGLASASDLDLIEIDGQTGYHLAAFTRVLGDPPPDRVSPSGGAFAQNPYFCTGLVNAVEAVLQVAGRADPTQIPGARLAAAHGCCGLAQQGHAVAIFESA